MEEVEVESHKRVDPWRDVVYLPRYEDEDPVSGPTSDYGGEDYSERGYGLEDSDNLDGHGDDGELAMTDAEVESILSAAPDLPEESDFSAIANGSYSNLDHAPSENSGGASTPAQTPMKDNNKTKLTEATLNSLRQSVSAALQNQAPSSPKPFLRSSSSTAATLRSQSTTDNNGGAANGKSERKLGPPIISVPPVIRRGVPREASIGTSTLRSSANTTRPSTNNLKPGMSTSANRPSVGSSAITGSRKPSRTADPRRSSTTTLPTRSAGVSSGNNLHKVTSMSKSVDLPSSSKVKQLASSVPVLKASGRRVTNSSAASPHTPGNYLKRTSPTVAGDKPSNDSSTKPSKKTPPSPAEPRVSTSLQTSSRGSGIPSSPTSIRKPPATNGMGGRETKPETVKKKITSSPSPSPSLGTRRASISEPVRRKSASPSLSSPSTLKPSPSERRLSLSNPKQKTSTEKLSTNIQSRTTTKSSPVERPSSSPNVEKSSPGSVVTPNPSKIIGKPKASSKTLAPSNSFRDRTPSPTPSKPLSADRGPSMLYRSKIPSLMPSKPLSANRVPTTLSRSKSPSPTPSKPLPADRGPSMLYRSKSTSTTPSRSLPADRGPSMLYRSKSPSPAPSKPSSTDRIPGMLNRSKSPSPMPSKPLSTDRGPGMLNRRKSLGADSPNVRPGISLIPSVKKSEASVTVDT
ncbi:uncharacterized protein [Physcomitrium patens]|uniref:Uncharacterized protein n=1 Tax=Physcomitrium patens TaxID=3218 RepID=A0A2K1JTM9_PHYPA|nr:mucin-5AC-like [Physcomitrium patens]XP_024387743.1 mucin-5AC-like [Physcomitrium patens]XP_024387744.1 mucin-5AC-like [Physcomitrium patens]XP_024387746.1 mucin-5AC-like [Physcomitrium patens]XP_024387747.1 mucin-5AC-like [Physcomitrium patens]PNR44885.1 hypothetical protein PHYPA_014655 [Physcomitrium patens]|eukprot:XP_024387742.1 mucin-5AC-like [Physcomitrella patens]